MELIFLVVACVLLVVTTSLYYLEREKSSLFHELIHDWEDEAHYWEDSYFETIHELNLANIRIKELELSLLSSITEKSEKKTKSKNKK